MAVLGDTTTSKLTSVGTITANSGIISNGTVKQDVGKTFTFRPGYATYATSLRYDTAGNEALILGMRNSVTSFIVKSGDSGTTDDTTTAWQSITPSLQVKGQCVTINKLIGNGASGSYNLDAAGTINASGAITKNGTAVMDEGSFETVLDNLISKY